MSNLIKPRDRFGRLVVVTKTNKKDRFGNFLWLLMCDCGNSTHVTKQRLMSGNTSSCGCLGKERRAKAIQKHAKPDLAAQHAAFLSYKRRAKVKEIPFELSEQEVIKLFESNCVYCGSSPSNLRKNRQGGKYVYNGIDRLNSQEGYTKDNSVACCKKCNFAKNNMSLAEFKDHIIKIYKFLLKYDD